MHRFAALSFLLLTTACLPGGKAPVPDAPEGTALYLDQQRAACEARGGRFSPAPGSGVLICLTIPDDANAPCVRASDCEGECLARSRSCAPIVPLYGCNEVLLENGQRAELCVE
ncbi:hypothetical protein [Tropicimonas sp.]|uniref:hypothetical protein n=1 Tax=Tropicimonas sp. TaxID=2067044 RepID=UPI003A8AED3A